MVGARKERKSRSLVVTGEGREGGGFFLRYARMERGDAWVGGRSFAEAGWKKLSGEAGYGMSGGEVWAGPISVRNNKRRFLGSEWSMSEVGTPPPHISEKPNGLVAIINNNRHIFMYVYIHMYVYIYISIYIYIQKSFQNVGKAIQDVV